MFSKSKLMFAVATAAAILASPAFAQSVDHTGTLFPSHYDENGKQMIGSWASEAPARKRIAAAQDRGLTAHAEVPVAQTRSALRERDRSNRT